MVTKCTLHNALSGQNNRTWASYNWWYPNIRRYKVILVVVRPKQDIPFFVSFGYHRKNLLTTQNSFPICMMTKSLYLLWGDRTISMLHPKTGACKLVFLTKSRLTCIWSIIIDCSNIRQLNNKLQQRNHNKIGLDILAPIIWQMGLVQPKDIATFHRVLWVFHKEGHNNYMRTKIMVA